MRSAAVTVPVAEPPWIYPTERTNVQAIIRTLWPHARTGDALPEGGAGLGRAHRLGPRTGEELAADGVRMPVRCGRTCDSPRLAIDPGHHHTVGGGNRSPRSGPGGRARKSLLPTDRPSNRVSSRALHRRCARLAHRCNRATAGLAPGLRLHD